MLRKKIEYKFSDLDIGKEQVERILGKDEGEGYEIISKLIGETLDLAASLSDIKAEYLVYENVSFEKSDWSVTIDGVKFGIGKIISGQMKRISKVALFTCTAGSRIGEAASELVRGADYLKGYILDIAGSEITEAAADLMQSELKESMAAEGLGITNRFSPGYCGWRLSEQHMLFSLMPGNFCGITLNESALMTPRKSVSGIIGIGEGVKMLPYTCSLCDDKNCIYRRKNG